MAIVSASQLSSVIVCARTSTDTPTLIILKMLRMVCRRTFILERASAFFAVQSRMLARMKMKTEREMKAMTMKLTRSLPVPWI